MAAYEITRCAELSDLCEHARDMVRRRNFVECIDMLRKAMAEYPSAPQPHNLLGIVLEKSGNHLDAMKHFRAAWALDPTYAPAGQNLSNYGTFCSRGAVAYDECDCPELQSPSCTIEYDAQGVGHVVRRR